jgi:hypothetical protein
MIGDIEQVRNGIQNNLFITLVQGGQMLGVAAIMLWIQPRLFLVLLTMAPILWAINQHFRGRILEASRTQQESFSRVTAALAETVQGIRVTQGFAREETNAGIVGPAYLWNKDKIHMYGGTITIVDGRFYEKHAMINEHRNVLHSQTRRTCDYVEYHCLLMKTELRDVLDSNYRCVHEHIDLCLCAKQLGHEIYIEPTSVITYLNNTKLEDYDIAFFTDRWVGEDCDHDIDHFCRKWGFPNTTFDDIRIFVKFHSRKARR